MEKSFSFDEFNRKYWAWFYAEQHKIIREMNASGYVFPNVEVSHSVAKVSRTPENKSKKNNQKKHSGKLREI